MADKQCMEIFVKLHLSFFINYSSLASRKRNMSMFSVKPYVWKWKVNLCVMDSELVKLPVSVTHLKEKGLRLPQHWPSRNFLRDAPFAAAFLQAKQQHQLDTMTSASQAAQTVMGPTNGLYPLGGPVGGIMQSMSWASSSGPGEYPCPQCNRTYRWKGSLAQHLRLECGKEPQFQCPYCPHRTKHKGNLNIHILGRHAGKPGIPVRGPYSERKYTMPDQQILPPQLAPPQ